MQPVELPQIDPYTPVRLLGEGSTTDTYLYRYAQRKKYVVMKLTRAPLQEKEAFLLRAKLLKKLKHRYITEVQDYGILHAGTAFQDHGYLVVQYTEGSTIHTHFSEGQAYPPDEVKRVFSPLADALNYAHVMNVVHGNLHPANILCSESKDFLLTDFSLLTAVQAEARPYANGADLYRSPEHLQGTAIAASDQYSLAVMVYEWLCGRRPYQATSREQLLFQQEHEPLTPPSRLNPQISPLVEQTLLQALALKPDERFPRMPNFADAYLRALMGFSRPVEIASTPGVEEKRQEDEKQQSSPHKRTERSRELKTLRSSLEKQEITPSLPPVATSTQGARAYQMPTHPEAQKVIQLVPVQEEQKIARQIESLPVTLELPTQKRLMQAVSDQGEPPEKPAQPKQLLQLSGDLSDLQRRVESDLRQGGVLSRSLSGYEERAAQIEMAELVARSLNENSPSIIEAGTGTGKSLAYLIPAVRSNKVAIISTANKALQEQLFYKDIPFVQKYIRRFDAALVKGMGNYICLDRVEQERVGLQHYAKNRDFSRLLNLLEESDEEFTGDFEALGFPLPPDIRSKVNADSDQCSWSKCAYFSECYVRKMRTKASRAAVIVVNHTLLLIDALMEGYLLPERDVIIIDEAHHLEEEATRAFTITISQAQITSLLAQHMLKNHTPPSLQEETKEVMNLAWERLYQVADPGYKGRANLKEPLQEGLGLASIVAKLADALRTGRPKDLPEKEEQIYDKLISRTQNLADHIRTVFSVNEIEKRVYYVERVTTGGRRGSQQLEISAAPLEITSWLKEHLFEKANVICTSATLATLGPDPAHPESKGPNFAYFRRRVGLDHTSYPDVYERILPLTFDYASHALLYLPRHLPEPAYGSGPAVEAYTRAIADEMMKLVEASRGRAFLLFSSKRMLDEVYALFQSNLPAHLKFPLFRQGDTTRIELVRSFRESQGAVLFGLKSFWEGVDIAGQALSLVVIDKLPFDPPDDPVHEARVAQMKAAGENWFGIYVLPQTVLRLKQGLGRLLRTYDDRGVMAILDTRLHTKSYGHQIVHALPPARRTTSLHAVEQFFQEDTEAPF